MNCIFCKIVRGEIKSFKINENDEFLAILDRFPNSVGNALVITKKHLPSYIFKMKSDDYHKLLDFSKKTARILDKKLNVKRTAMIMEGLGINHAHIKLYPIHGLKKEFKELWPKKKIFFKKYEGYLTSQLGPRANNKKLEIVWKKFKKKRSPVDSNHRPSD